jgi:antitoxin Phd
LAEHSSIPSTQIWSPYQLASRNAGERLNSPVECFANRPQMADILLRFRLFSLHDHCGHMGPGMREIQLKDAKANLSAVVDQAARGEPSLITRHGKPEAVVLGFADWQRLSRVPSFRRLLMSAPLERDDLPERDRSPLRDAGL